MKISPLHMAALAVVAIDGLRVAGTRPPFITTDDFVYAGVLDDEGKHWVVKYPLTDHGGTLLEAETAVASSLLGELRSGRLSFDVMRPEGYAAYEGRRAVVYPAPLGKTCSFDEMSATDARELGRTIATIHTLDPSVVTSAGLPAYSADEVRDRLVTELEDANEAATVPTIVRRRWLNMLDSDELWEFSPVVAHGDIADEHFLWSEGVIRTVLGFGETHVGDPSTDIAPLLPALPEDIFQEFYEAYCHSLHQPADEHLLERATLMSEFAYVRWLMHGVLTNSSEIIDDATVMLEQLALNIEADPHSAPGPAWHVDSAQPVQVDAAELVHNTDSAKPVHSDSAQPAQVETAELADVDSAELDADSTELMETGIHPASPHSSPSALDSALDSTLDRSLDSSVAPTALTADLSLTADTSYDSEEI